ncbi:MAG TPA: hypothetical protein VJK51_04265 [Candidatus Nanoarchaeia archaeon]|nr:hypothetical protein [Candidatus Nanoarchaeia archaeon]
MNNIQRTVLTARLKGCVGTLVDVLSGDSSSVLHSGKLYYRPTDEAPGAPGYYIGDTHIPVNKVQSVNVGKRVIRMAASYGGRA